ncbi:Sensor protein CitS [Bhargavaea cecembensis DSE10]|uniref:histidine kinase n=1 Tax=Bhargavaea cecembensis DSE10 TaxID=1235279 RepID=M7NZ01_9BACL|nr:sensor histidine kinase [Bhargavaea cecembensis]EMR06885.1 Sensor protein CitS [Bhargavaea cecembensis DSE10]
MKKLFEQIQSSVSIQLKILGLVTALILFIVVTITGIFIFFEYREDIKAAEKMAYQTARALSYMPTVQESLQDKEDIPELRNIMDNLLRDTNASAVVMTEGERFFVTAGDEEMILKVFDHPPIDKAIIFGSSYIERLGTNKMTLVGVSPLLVDYGDYKKIDGTIMVIYDGRLIIKSVIRESIPILTVSSIALIVGLLGSFLLARDIKKDTLGLEPREIAFLYQERKTVFSALTDGMIVTDEERRVRMMNPAAKRLFRVTGTVRGKLITEVIGDSDFPFLKEGFQGDEEFELGDLTIIASRQHIRTEGRITGTILTFRDKTDLRKMSASLSETRRVTEDLRAQTHEYKNKLYVILGLIQLNKNEQAISFIRDETQSQENYVRLVSSSIRDEKLQAIILGKLAKASEQHVSFKIDPGSSLASLPDSIDLNGLVTILGNLIDNAVEAVRKQKNGEVVLFVSDMGTDILFEVSDNGPGIPEKSIVRIFERGISGKGPGRGYGLANVKKEVGLLGGEIEVQSNPEGTTFSVFLPKNR